MSSLGGSLDSKARLWTIARRVLATERSYTQAHVVTKLETHLRVSPERAEAGFNLMLSEGVITPDYGEPRRYYLTDTTPF